TRAVQDWGGRVDLNRDGVADATDAQLLAGQVIDDLRRIFEPFDVNIQEVNAASIDDVKFDLSLFGTHDAYVFACGGTSPAAPAQCGGWPGASLLDPGNTRDGTAFAFAESVLTWVGTDLLPAVDPGTGPDNLIAHVIAGEAGRTFGLNYVDPLEGFGDAMARI